ncbi:MoxR family ATPase [Pseudoclavibacter chungangensis]|uniref:MoxR family ATPase n=1 Tax=Pseudoclavibacter chungangensis TaxID=587635 RepID=A0A7J5BZQ3_9MICO|nr:MoxR family ATPase [Pseudoclavibacter chungangensis]KAB1659635.1 MoxR family ATPase [Pseudoclavibacter chungangensis]NYJ67470.1 MoxR-like ATPase [Pseudoclavibacter chungangensis]
MTETSSSVASPRRSDRLDAAEFERLVGLVRENVRSVVEGKDEQIHLALVTLLAGGHLLVEDVPGVGKTVLAKTLAASMSATVNRIQFTPDLLPSDVTGVAVYDQVDRRFEFQPGPVFANVVIGDEINRASPKTQSALLECMAEGQVSVDGETHRLPEPFTVFATQNPSEMEGTYALPEAQRDRFMVRMSMGYPSREAEYGMVASRDGGDPLRRLRPVVSADDVRRMIESAATVYMAPAVGQYVVDLARATREHPDVRVGVSPRASLHLVGAAKANAAVSGRDYVVPDDVARLAPPVFAHRLVLNSRGSRPGGSDGEAVVAQILQRVPAPTAA